MLPHSVVTFSAPLAKHLMTALGCHRLLYFLTSLTLQSTLGWNSWCFRLLLT